MLCNYYIVIDKSKNILLFNNFVDLNHYSNLSYIFRFWLKFLRVPYHVYNSGTKNVVLLSPYFYWHKYKT